MSKKILIVRLDRIGDVILSTPVIKALRDAYPDSHIAFMVRPYAFDVVNGNPHLNEVIVYDKNGSEKGLAGNVRFISKLRREKFDLAVVLHPTNRSHLLAFFAGIPERIGYNRKLGLLLTKRLVHAKQFGLKHERDYALDLLSFMEIAPVDKKLCMPVNEESERKIEKIFRENGIGANDTVVVIHPAASCASKRWQTDRFARVADALVERCAAKIVVISGTNDRKIGDKLVHAMKKGAVNLTGKTSVADLASLLRRSKLLVSNDSGPVHVACAVGAPVVAIFGRDDRGLSPRRWGPTGERDVVLHKEVGCVECLAHNCRLGFKCLSAISVEDVLAAAERILKR